MGIRLLFGTALIVCLSAAGAIGLAPVAEADAGGKRYTPGRDYVLEGRRLRRGLRIPLPIGPSYLFYDYPYYYSRGYYPTHIGGYVYYPALRRGPAYRARCSDWRRACRAHTSAIIFRRNGGSCRCR